MAIVRRKKRGAKPRGILVRFQPWLIAGGVVLNVIASGSAGLSAYFAYKQIGVALEAVNAGSRNQAFSDYLSAYTEVCKVSLVPQDQDDMWTFRANQDSYEPARHGEMFEIRELNVDQIEDRTPEQVDAFLEEATKKRELMWERWTQLLIWIDEPMKENLSVQTPDYARFFLDNEKMPPAYYAVQQQRRCRILLGTLIDLYKNPNDGEAKDRQMTSVWVIPQSDKQSTEDIMKGWGREDVIKNLTEKKLWPTPQ